MNLEKVYIEEDLFPREITSFEKREYGYLFYNDDNKDSYDSNHAIMFKDKISNIESVLDDIIKFYEKKGTKPIIYQSIREEGYFKEIDDILQQYGFESFEETQKYMILEEKNIIIPNSYILVEKVSKWKDIYGREIFEKAGEPWEIDVAKAIINKENTLFFVAFYDEKPVGMTYGHVTDGVCRVDYLLVSKEYRNMGVGRSLIHSFVKYCDENNVKNCYLWPDGDTAERIYFKAGFRVVEIKQAGRAVRSI